MASSLQALSHYQRVVRQWWSFYFKKMLMYQVVIPVKCLVYHQCITCYKPRECRELIRSTINPSELGVMFTSLAMGHHLVCHPADWHNPAETARASQIPWIPELVVPPRENTMHVIGSKLDCIMKIMMYVWYINYCYLLLSIVISHIRNIYNGYLFSLQWKSGGYVLTIVLHRIPRWLQRLPQTFSAIQHRNGGEVVAK